MEQIKTKTHFMLRIEHPVRDYKTWKKAFDSNPAQRREGGVLSYRISRLIDNQSQVFIDLEFGSQEQMEKFHGVLQTLWTKVNGKLIDNPKGYPTVIVEEEKS
jgi:hypothetical protein